MTVIYNMAKKYYPDLWNFQRVELLYNNGKLTEEEYNDVIGVTKETTEEVIEETVENTEGYKNFIQR